MKAALVDSENRVVNVIMWDSTCQAPEGTTAIVLEDTFPVAPGWKWISEYTFEQVEEPVPVKVPNYITRRQCAIELRERGLITALEALEMTRTGIPPAMIQAIFNTMSEEDGIIAATEFAADRYSRSHILIIQIISSTGATSEDIDNFFISASNR